jgi:hypothetical protein
VRQHDVKSLKIRAVVGLRSFDQRHELLRGGKQRGVFEEETRARDLFHIAIGFGPSSAKR